MSEISSQSFKNWLFLTVKKYIPVSARRWIVRMRCWPPVGFVNFGSFKRLRPISPDWGSERGHPIDRYYIEKFLSENMQFIRGRVLEIGDNRYTMKYASPDFEKSDVLHVSDKKPGVTIIADLTSAENIPDNTFDSIILTQTLQFIYDVPAVIGTVYRILKPGGNVLVTVPGICQICRYDMDHWGEYWRFTTRSIKKLFEASFPAQNIQIMVYGNVKVSVALLHGIAHEELRRKDLDYFDPDYEMLIAVRATKS